MFESPWHWIVLAIIALVLFFGWKQLPEMSRSLGRSLRIFKTEIKGMTQDDEARAAEEKGRDASQPRELEPGKPPAAPAEPPRAEFVKNADAQRARPRPTPRQNLPQ